MYLNECIVSGPIGNQLVTMPVDISMTSYPFFIGGWLI